MTSAVHEHTVLCVCVCRVPMRVTMDGIYRNVQVLPRSPTEHAGDDLERMEAVLL